MKYIENPVFNNDELCLLWLKGHLAALEGVKDEIQACKTRFCTIADVIAMLEDKITQACVDLVEIKDDITNQIYFLEKVYDSLKEEEAKNDKV